MNNLFWQSLFAHKAKFTFGRFEFPMRNTPAGRQLKPEKRGYKICEDRHDYSRKQNSEADDWERFSYAHIKQRGDERARPAARAGKRYRDKQKQSPIAPSFDFVAFSHGTDFKLFYNLFKPALVAQKLKNLSYKNQNKWYRDYVA